MRMSRLLEFLDQEGSYALVRPLDDTRGRVVYSTVHEQGEILYKDPRLTWDEASHDAGGCTRMGPSDFALGSPKEGDLDAEDFHGHEENRVLFELLEHSEVPRSRSRVRKADTYVLSPAGSGEPPDDLLMHLVVHYLRMTEAGHDDGRWHHVCSCSEERLPRKNAGVLHDVIGIALKSRGLPSLEMIISALEAVRAEEVNVG